MQMRDTHSCFIAASSLEKGNLVLDDFIAVDIHTGRDTSFGANPFRKNRFTFLKMYKSLNFYALTVFLQLIREVDIIILPYSFYRH
ncbi:hypothetical protein BG74_07240 [Sodalis-like endosymbiont of Proechinophthirus fluctus]|nr:hypothetical protein BG74_07240 [Sodalis-like endosymbiont of Proechinophthirus fluctus]